MENRPFYHKLYADMIREKFPNLEQRCANYLNKENWTALDVIEINTILFAKKREEKAFNQRHRAYDYDSIRYILRDQKENMMNNKDISLKYKISRNTITKWRKLFEEEV